MLGQTEKQKWEATMSKAKVGLVQQGDVLAFRETALPEGVKVLKPTPRGYVLAEGEVTGHAHVVDVDASKVQAFIDDLKQVWLVVKDKPVTVRHEEHGAVTLDKGVWKIGIVREVDPFTDEIHAVRD